MRSPRERLGQSHCRSLPLRRRATRRPGLRSPFFSVRKAASRDRAGESALAPHVASKRLLQQFNFIDVVLIYAIQEVDQPMAHHLRPRGGQGG
jgi:hypothetical protein